MTLERLKHTSGACIGPLTETQYNHLKSLLPMDTSYKIAINNYPQVYISPSIACYGPKSSFSTCYSYNKVFKPKIKLIY